MKRARRALSLLLALALAFTLSPAAHLADADDTDPPDGEENPPVAGGVTDIQLDGGIDLQNGVITMDHAGDGPKVKATPMPEEANRNTPVTWKSKDTSVVTVQSPDDTHTGHIIGVAPGETTVEVTAGNVTRSIEVRVSGIKLAEGAPFTYDANGTPTVSVDENARVTLTPKKDFFYYGRTAKAYPDEADSSAAVSVKADKNTIVRVSGGKEGITLQGLREGRDRVTISVQIGSTTWTASFYVEVKASEKVIEVSGVSGVNPLHFSTLESRIAALCQQTIEGAGNTLVSITGLSVDTAEGTLYLGYQSPDDTGSGVGSALTYYVSSQRRGPYIKDVTFVPNPTFTGSRATITFTGTSESGDIFRGKLSVALEDATTDVTLTASPESPAKFSGALFGEVCQRQTGSPLSYVIFTLPPASQGVLYKGYVDANNYAARVTASDRYSQTDLGDLTFVPTPGYVGQVAVSYAGYSVTGLRYNGELHINVAQSLDEGISYQDGGSGSVSFSEADFAAYCANVTGGRLRYVSFTPPAASQGILYRSWSGRGSQVTAGDRFLANQRVSTIDPITFVSAEGFHGIVRIPFSGEDWNGVSFTGIVEIHIQSGGSGDITYSCTPGGSVKLSSGDFNDMCRKLTGQRLHYVTFQSLPAYTDGALYHNRTSAGVMGDSVSREARYYNSAAPYLMNVSFWASDSFRGSVEIPFTGCAVSGETFSGLLVINASTSVGGSHTISYDTSGRQPVAFQASDFDKVSRSAVDSALHYLRFTLPSSGQGILYFDYNPAVTPVSITSTDTLYQGGEASVSKVSFIPAYGFSGTVQIPFTGWAISGAQFQGTVEIAVRGGATDTTVRYASRGEPVPFANYEFLGAGGSQPVSIRLDALPAEREGKLYYQYTCPTKYSWMAAVGTAYYISGDPQIASLTFVPRAGFTGTASIPYTATNADGTSFSGQIDITVEPVTSSAFFNDLSGASSETLAAVDFLYNRNVVGGLGAGRYGPQEAIRRGDFCLMLYRAFQFSADGEVAPFSDVPLGAYYAQAVQVLRSLGIVNGTGGNRFEPSANISRQDAALMIQRALRAAGIAAPDGSPTLLRNYGDGVLTAAYAQGAMAGLIQLELLPTSWTQLWPSVPLTREDMAVLLHRAITR